MSALEIWNGDSRKVIVPRQAMTAAGRHAGGWTRGTKNRFTLHPPKSAAAVEIDPASLF